MSDSLQLPIRVEGLSRQFGRRRALDNVSLEVPAGSVFGLVGENGAGKTTLLKHLLGLLKAESGSVRVFGADPVKHPVEVLARIGFVSENRDLPGWMRIGELLRYLEPFYATWDSQFAESLRSQFELEPDARIKNLSRGQLAKAGLLVALAHRPELLVLDEPVRGSIRWFAAIFWRQLSAPFPRMVAPFCFHPIYSMKWNGCRIRSRFCTAAKWCCAGRWMM